MSEEIKPAHSSGSITGWAVEARVQGHQPHVVDEHLILDNNWRRLSFTKAPPGYGVPAPQYHDAMLRHCSLQGYEAAQALRWWFHAEIRNTPANFSLETRLVSHRVGYKIEWQAEGEQDHVGTWDEKEKGQ